ncbi:MAG: hypothetical protein V3T72_02725 [Thermoanaerobaculia bacterium]
MTTRQILFLLLILATLPIAAAADSTTDTPTDRRIVREGIAIELDIEPLKSTAGSASTLREGDTVTFRFQITDTNTDTPLSGVYPAAWMDIKPEAEPETCQDKVEAFIGGSLFAPPELDLNVYYVLALNDDASISVVDPLFGFGTTKLLDMIFLESPGEDWALAADQMTLYVSMPAVHQVAVASTATWEVTTNLSVGFQPSRVALQGDGKYLWVGTAPWAAVSATTRRGSHQDPRQRPRRPVGYRRGGCRPLSTSVAVSSDPGGDLRAPRV